MLKSLKKREFKKLTRIKNVKIKNKKKTKIQTEKLILKCRSLVKTMIKNFFFLKKQVNKKELNKLADAVMDLKDIAERIFQRIDNKISELNEIEKRLDEKIKKLEQLSTKEEPPKISKMAYDKRNEIVKLLNTGMELKDISKTLNIPLGEVELIVNLYKIKTKEK